MAVSTLLGFGSSMQVKPATEVLAVWNEADSLGVLTLGSMGWIHRNFASCVSCCDVNNPSESATAVRPNAPILRCSGWLAGCLVGFASSILQWQACTLTSPVALGNCQSTNVLLPAPAPPLLLL